MFPHCQSYRNGGTKNTNPQFEHMDKSLLQLISSDSNCQPGFSGMNLAKDLDWSGFVVSQAALGAKSVVCNSFYRPNEKTDAILSKAFREFAANLDARLDNLQEASYRNSLCPFIARRTTDQPYIADSLSCDHAISALSAGRELGKLFERCVHPPRSSKGHAFKNSGAVLDSVKAFNQSLLVRGESNSLWASLTAFDSHSSASTLNLW